YSLRLLALRQLHHVTAAIQNWKVFHPSLFLSASSMSTHVSSWSECSSLSRPNSSRYFVSWDSKSLTLLPQRFSASCKSLIFDITSSFVASPNSLGLSRMVWAPCLKIFFDRVPGALPYHF